MKELSTHLPVLADFLGLPKAKQEYMLHMLEHTLEDKYPPNGESPDTLVTLTRDELDGLAVIACIGWEIIDRAYEEINRE